MNRSHTLSRYSLLWIVILCYFAPLLAIAGLSISIRQESADWNILSLGFFLTFSFSLFLFWLFSKWEKALSLTHKTPGVDPDEHMHLTTTIEIEKENIEKEKIDLKRIDQEEHDLLKRCFAEAQQAQIRLLTEIDTLTDEIKTLSTNKENNLLESKEKEHNFQETISGLTEQLKQQQHYIRELQETIAEQKTINDKKEQQVLQLETKVNDLTSEIKTLLKFAEAHHEPLGEEHNPPPIMLYAKNDKEKDSHTLHSPFLQQEQEVSNELKQYLDIAQKIKVSQRFGSQIYSFLDSPTENFSIDLRRLCDRLRSESQSTVLLFSPKDNHLLFASNQIKSLTGWSPEKFTQNFFEIIQNNSEWKKGISSLAIRSESQISLLLKTKSGSNLSVKANLGIIPTGIFRNHIIAVLDTSQAASSTSFF